MNSAANMRLLIVAGHDPSGGAGIDADVESVRDLPIESATVVTAFTDQDDRSVRSIGARDAQTWRDEAVAHVSRGVSAVKFGLLPGADHVRAAAHVCRALRESARTPPPIIVDPVIASSSGALFMDVVAVRALLVELIPLAVVLTPNLAEAAQLAHMSVEDLARDPERRRAAADALLALGASAVIIKGGHGDEDPSRDLIAAAGRSAVWHEHARIRGGKIRGSGCRYATRLAAGLALGRTLEASAHEAGAYVARLISERATR